MYIELDGDNGSFKGTYASGVSEATRHPLVGFRDINLKGDQQQPNALGWVVSYQGHQSTCAWSGQVYEENGLTKIHTTWNLSQSLGEKYGIWNATNVGVDAFTRCGDEEPDCIKIEHISPRHSSSIPQSVLKKLRKAIRGLSCC